METHISSSASNCKSLSIKKIVVIGPESTGKSTLSAGVAARLQTVWVPEYARAYLEQLGRPYAETDLLEIARGQLQAEDELLQQANKSLICDTDLNVIKVWSEHKYGRCDNWILEQIASRTYDLYVLTDIDIEWQNDPLREHPQHEMRQYFFNVYNDIVQQSGLPWIIVSGAPEIRLQQALQAMDTLLH
jgi:NadR type nicotinamide-nucleotide adenylyltransferase